MRPRIVQSIHADGHMLPLIGEAGYRAQCDHGQGAFGCSVGWEARMTYKTVLIRSDEGFAVSVPGLPGCWSQGSTEAEALANIQDAIRDYLSARDELIRGLEVREVEVQV